MIVKRKVFPLVFIFTTWVIYAFCYYILKQNISTSLDSGYLSLIGEAGLDIVLMVLTILLWKKSLTQHTRKIFGIFAISFICAAIADTSYNFILNIFGVAHFSDLVDTIFDLPFLFFLILQAIMWIYIFVTMRPKEKPAYSSYVPIIAIGVFIFYIFVFGIRWDFSVLTLQGLYQLLDTITEAVGFIFAMFCLTSSVRSFIRFTSLGYLLVVSSDFIIRSAVVTATLIPDTFWEMTWILGLLIMVWGYADMLIKKVYLEDELWLYSVDSIQFRVTSWGLMLCILSLVSFLAITFLMLGNSEIKFLKLISPQSLSSIIIVFSVCITIINTSFSNKLLNYFIE